MRIAHDHASLTPRVEDRAIPLKALDLTWITDTLAIGGSFAPEHAGRLRTEHRVEAVIDLRSEARDEETSLAAQAIAFLHLPTQDLGAVTLAMLDAGVTFARTHIERRSRVLIHCEHGIGRSATLALCALVDGGLPPLTALRLAKDRRERVSPSPAQYECFCRWLTLHRARLGGAWDIPRFDDFAAIAYRHLKGGA